MDDFGLHTDRKRVAHNIRELRTKQGLSIRKLANMASISFKYLLLIEQAESSPTVDTLSKIAGALGVDIRDLFD